MKVKVVILVALILLALSPVVNARQETTDDDTNAYFLIAHVFGEVSHLNRENGVWIISSNRGLDITGFGTVGHTTGWQSAEANNISMLVVNGCLGYGFINVWGMFIRA